MSSDKIFDLTAGVYFYFHNIDKREKERRRTETCTWNVSRAPVCSSKELTYCVVCGVRCTIRFYSKHLEARQLLLYFVVEGCFVRAILRILSKQPQLSLCFIADARNRWESLPALSRPVPGLARFANRTRAQVLASLVNPALPAAQQARTLRHAPIPRTNHV